MVNIGGRSKGCSTCRKRRVKCDESRPICDKCQRLGLECDGPKGTAFIDSTISSQRRVEHRLRVSSPSPEAGASSSSASVCLPTPSAPLVGNPQDIFIMFTRKQLAQDGPVDIALQELQSRDSIQFEANQLALCTTSHLRAGQSFATIMFGTRHNSPEITKQGYTSHGATLQQLNRALSNSNCHKFDEILVSITTLAIQETLVPTGRNFYMSHILGIEKLLELRNPREQCSPKTVDLYKCLRYMLLFASLKAGTGSVFAKPEWKSVLREHCEDKIELQEQDMYDVLADCSVLAAELKTLVRESTMTRERSEDQMSRIVSTALALREQLRVWRAPWDIEESRTYIDPACLTRSQLHGESSNSTTGLIPTANPVLSNVLEARTIMIYNVTLLNVLQILIALPFDLQQHQSANENYYRTAHSSILEIHQTLTFSPDQKANSQLQASPLTYWAIQTSKMVLASDQSTEGKLVGDMLRRKSEGTGAAVLWTT